MESNQSIGSKMPDILFKLLLCAFFLFLCLLPSVILGLIFMDPRMVWPLRYGCYAILPVLVVGLVFCKKRLKFLKYWGIAVGLFVILSACNFWYISYDESITIDTSPSIATYDYLPFREDSKIVRLDKKASLQLQGELPRIDGATAAFPVYSAFVNATYPDTVELYDGVFEYNNTRGGYEALAERNTDIFFGAYPSKAQLAYAAEQGTEFVFTPIGKEAFVFFVHRDNPVENLTQAQIQKIYIGEITNWSQVGGKNEPIVAYQRSEGSGSQSMLLRFMNGQQPMAADTETKIGGMLGIIETVADYRSKPGSIGFSFRYYVEGIIQNPDIKMLSIDGVAPTVENIQNGTYPITTDVYAVTWAENPNPNVALLLEWVLGEEGQEIIRRTGYVPLR